MREETKRSGGKTECAGPRHERRLKHGSTIYRSARISPMFVPYARAKSARYKLVHLRGILRRSRRACDFEMTRTRGLCAVLLIIAVN